MLSKLTPLFKFLYNPLEAVAQLQVRAPFLTGCALALTATLAYDEALDRRLYWMLSALVNSSALDVSLILLRIFRRFLAAAAPLVFLSLVFIPACLLAVRALTGRSSFGVLLRQEYAPVGSCILYSWAAAHLVMVIPALLIAEPRSGVETVLRLTPLPYFVFLVALSLRVALRMTYGRAVTGVALASLSLLLLPLAPTLFRVLASPFLAILLFIVLRNVLGEALGAQRQRERFRRNLEAATLNPADASAHYNLGLIYQQRGQYEDAKACFRRAVEIDYDETDAHYQLGRIAREEGRLTDAIAHFDAVVRRNPAHSQNEVWREIGRAYLQAGQHEDARTAFERFLVERESDAEGRYHYALTLDRLGYPADAISQMQAVIEAVRTSPSYKYRAEKQWMNEAQAFLRSQATRSQ